MANDGAHVTFQVVVVIAWSRVTSADLQFSCKSTRKAASRGASCVAIWHAETDDGVEGLSAEHTRYVHIGKLFRLGPDGSVANESAANGVNLEGDTSTMSETEFRALQEGCARAGQLESTVGLEGLLPSFSVAQLPARGGGVMASWKLTPRHSLFTGDLFAAIVEQAGECWTTHRVVQRFGLLRVEVD